MILDEPGNFVPYAAFLVRQLMQLRSLSPLSNIGDAIEQLLPGTFQQLYRPATPICPSFVYCGNVSRKIFFIDGVTTSDQATRLINGYDDSDVIGGFNPVNQWIRNAAQQVLAAIDAPGIQAAEHVDFVGYSAGGAIAAECKRVLVSRQSTLKSKVVSFGAPRAFSSPGARLLASSPVTRWMTDRDPIPLIPPRILDSPVLLATNSFLTNTRWGNYAHTNGGISINASGSTSEAVLPPQAAMSATTSLLNWFFAVEGEANNPHALTTYLAYLSTAEGLYQRVQDRTRPEGPVEARQQEERRDLTARQRHTQTQINEAGHAQNQVPLVIPPMRIFQAIRMGKVWGVTLGGELVCLAPSKKRAQATARAGNNFVRRLPRQALVQPDALIQQFTAFIVASADPAGEFEPKLRTSL